MPLTDEGLREAQENVMHMIKMTLETIQMIQKNADDLYGKNSDEVRSAINEYMADFVVKTEASGETPIGALIFKASTQNFQRAGFYGAQLEIKSRQVMEANFLVQDCLTGEERGEFRSRFEKWVMQTDSFLANLPVATGVNDPLRALKDSLQYDLPEDIDNGQA